MVNIQNNEEIKQSDFFAALMLDLRTDFLLPCKLIA